MRTKEWRAVCKGCRRARGSIPRATTENISASRSHILDADFATETAELTRNRILCKAGTAIAAQANALPIEVLQPLQF